MQEKNPGIVDGDLTGFDVSTDELDRLIDEVVPFFEPEAHRGETGRAFEDLPRLRGLLDSVNDEVANELWIYLSDRLRADAWIGLHVKRMLEGIDLPALVDRKGNTILVPRPKVTEAIQQKLIQFVYELRAHLRIETGAMFREAHEAIYGEGPGAMLEIEELSDRVLAHTSGVELFAKAEPAGV